MKTQQGLVIEQVNGLARIRVGRHNECTSCGACPSSQHVMVEAVDPIGVHAGQRVQFAVQEQHVLTGAFVVFVLPLVCAGLGALLGFWLAQQEAEAGNFAIGGALAGFLGSLLAVKAFDRRAARSQETKPVIIDVLEKG